MDLRLLSVFEVLLNSKIEVREQEWLKNTASESGSFIFRDDSLIPCSSTKRGNMFSGDTDKKTILVSFCNSRVAPSDKIKTEWNCSEYHVIPSFSNPRWIINVKSPVQSGMTNSSGILSRAALCLFNYFRKINIAKLIFPCRIFVYSDSRETFISSHILDPALKNNFFEIVSIYTGTPGPMQKTTVEIVSQFGKRYYLKIPSNQLTMEKIRNESRSLDYLGLFRFEYLILPEHSLVSSQILNRDILLQSDVSSAIIPGAISDGILDALCELQVLTSVEESDKRNDLEILGNNQTAIRDMLKSIEHPYIGNVDLDFYLALLVKNTKKYFSGEVVKTSFSHGDFTRWNIRVNGSVLCVFDWEEAKFRSLGYDFYHYVFIRHALINNSSGESYLKECDVVVKKNIHRYDAYFNQFVYADNRYLCCHLVELVNQYIRYIFECERDGFSINPVAFRLLDFVLDIINVLFPNDGYRK